MPRPPITSLDDLAQDLTELKERWPVQLAATVLGESAEPLGSASRPDRLALLVGNEAHGLDLQWLELCDRKITIAMRTCDASLNVAVSAGIFLYHFTR